MHCTFVYLYRNLFITTCLDKPDDPDEPDDPDKPNDPDKPDNPAMNDDTYNPNGPVKSISHMDSRFAEGRASWFSW